MCLTARGKALAIILSSCHVERHNHYSPGTKLSAESSPQPREVGNSTEKHTAQKVTLRKVKVTETGKLGLW